MPVRAVGPLVDHQVVYRQELLARGYTEGTVRHRMSNLRALSAWMARSSYGTEDLGETVIRRFVEFHASVRSKPPGLREMLRVLEVLRCCGVAPAPLLAEGGVEELLVEYRQWLVTERELASATVPRYLSCARRFLTPVLASGDSGLAGVTAASVNAFVLVEAGRCSVGATKGRVSELRAMLRFLHARGVLAADLSVCVPTVAGWAFTGVPQTLTTDQVAALCSGFASSPVGVRDRAIMLLLARLGLRSIEIARLQLRDVNWRAGELHVRGKAARRDVMPLPEDVGQAISGYLIGVRGRSEFPQVFLRLRAPAGPIPADLVHDVVRRACRRAELPIVGAHRLRHSLAAGLLARGSSLAEVSQVLRHTDLATTSVYAKVDLPALRSVAQPWPGAR